MNLFSALNFWLRNAHDIPESIGIVFLYRPGRAVWNFHLCELLTIVVQGPQKLAGRSKLKTDLVHSGLLYCTISHSPLPTMQSEIKKFIEHVYASIFIYN